MNTALFLIESESEFATAEDAAAYDRWFRDQVQATISTRTPAFRTTR